MMDENFKLELLTTTFMTKIKRHHGKQFLINKTQEDALLSKVVPKSGDKRHVDLVSLQELMGFDEQVLLEVQGNAYRRIAMEIQTNMQTI